MVVGTVRAVTLTINYDEWVRDTDVFAGPFFTVLQTLEKDFSIGSGVSPEFSTRYFAARSPSSK